MEVKPFKGGLNVPHYKSFSEKKAIKMASLPSEIIVPLSQHIGAPCAPLVEVGDAVKAGEKIGESESFVSAPVHASLSGTVTAIEDRPHPGGGMVKSIVIQVDKTQIEMDTKERDLNKVSSKEIIEAVKEAGVVGMGGAAFPTAVKLQPPPDKPIDVLLINGCECEPFLTCDHRIMLEMAEEILEGTRLIQKALGVKKAYICIEDNKGDAIKVLRDTNKDPGIGLLKMPTRYPQGSEKQMIKAAVDREVPSGGLPFDVGVLVQNVGTAVAVYEAVKYSKPLTQRVVTVTGQNIADPQNLMVKIGTPLHHLIQECGGIKKDPAKVIMGGPMTGVAQQTLEAPVIKGITGITVLPPKLSFSEPDYTHCVRCGKCVDHCPMLLYPNQISIYCEANMVREAEKWNTMDCVECGICSYVCPSRRPIVHFVQKTKPKIQALPSQGSKS